MCDLHDTRTYELVQAEGLRDPRAQSMLNELYEQGCSVGYLVDMSAAIPTPQLNGHIEFLDGIIDPERLRVAFFQCYDPHVINAVNDYLRKGYRILLTGDARQALAWCRGEIR